MKVCKVYPTHYDCRKCVDTWELYSGDVSQMPDCKTCSFNTREYEVVQFVTNFWGTSVILQKDGKLVSVGMSRIHDLREVNNGD